MPLSAFWNAYQVGKKPNEPTTTTMPSTENDNESHHEEAPPTTATMETKAEENENEQPLDYTTSKSPETNDNNLPLHDDDEHGINSISSDRIENSSNGNNSEKIPKFKITRLNMKRTFDRDSKDFASESCRPLRKRRIIAEVDNLSESP
jgi:hypothetical protein